ncbi:MAG: DsbE family thiol:disulfide interchange protein [Paracoccus sp. (in: a-proteobacteria)]|jgi:cytochrome c biogenesis protein CcmG/thiol:disulfide interchange protein DsbE|uniref:DsbE family thiol:disulfide interchange protein n=1 Tax=unclassified Paracoccus (in: a-proteobacteria) TaxID=2688777 RepID=UPI00236CB123|nr:MULTISPECIES: DsbE family thiol:disulfide interchange protein [unclassified Paracoccus (in: a-proteobacteria)]MDB2552604.1 DsbE family thiol:disulfide interchange protein [Paracoccus sp. (in: a-proteobacteria)]|tara:strand:- start:788 stop:1366 length:579 start_codon:yes stop_codon:yes gene_type:complete
MSPDLEQEPRRRGGRLVLLLPLAVFGLVGAAFFWGLLNNNSPLPSPLIGKPVPEFTLPPIEGRDDGLSSADLRGQVSLVNVWASWCVPCRAENPLMVELSKTGEVPIYGINYKDKAGEALAFLDELGDPFTRIGADLSGRVAIDWGVYGIPETFVIDAAGRVAYKHVGPFNRQILEEDILPVVRKLQREAGQ